MNPAALHTNLGELKRGGILIVNTEAYSEQNLRRAGYAKNPLEDGSLDRYQLFKIDITKLRSTRCRISGSATEKRPLQELLRARAHLVALPPTDRIDRELDPH